MKREQLQQHPAYLALTPEERAAVDERLGVWQLDTEAAAALTGGLAELEASDLRFWLASTAARPWTMLSMCAQPAEADAIFQALLAAAAPELSERDDRAELIELARSLSRALVVAESARAKEGFVREEQLGALAVRLHELEDRVHDWDDDVTLAILRERGLDELARELVGYAREHRGLRGLLKRAGERLQTNLFDLVHGTLFVATGAPDHEGHHSRGTWRNWTDDYRVSPSSFVCPGSEDELCAAVAQARKVRVVGAGHSFNDGPLCSDRMISLDALDRIIQVDAVAKTARVQGGIRLRDLNRALWNAGLGLPVLGSTDAQSVAGLVSTDLHGTGRDHGFLSEQILSLRIVAASGEVQTVRRGDPLFHAAIGAIGTCGVILEVELQLVDSFRLEKRTEMVDRGETEDGIDGALADNEHISFYYIGGSTECEAIRMHRWNRTDGELTTDWEKCEASVELSDFAISAYAPGFARSLADIDEDAGLSDALAPDRRLIMPGSRGFGRRLFYRHDEIEFGVPFEQYRECVGKIVSLLEGEGFFSIIEVRFTPDHSQALLGPGVGRRTAYIELATPLSQDRERIYAMTEYILRDHGGQPHLGKKTNVTTQDMLEIYGDRFTRFQVVRAAQDPDGKFLNPFCERVFG
jgi:FAD/FMN-containing dehydrogenase